MPDGRSISRTRTRRLTACSLGAAALLGCETVVSTVDVGDVTVFPSSMTLATGDTATAAAIVTDIGGGYLPDMPVIWTVDDPAIAMVDAQGVVEARAPGTTTVRAASQGVAGSAQVRVLGEQDPGPSCKIEDQTFDDDFEIPRNMTCVLTNVRIRGQLELREGARLVATGLIVDEHFKSNGALDLVLSDSWIGGDLVLERGGSVMISSSRVAKKLDIKSNVGVIAVSDSEVEETLKLEDNRGGPFTLLRNTSDKLDCRGNQPLPTGAGNVGDDSGQCRGF